MQCPRCQLKLPKNTLVCARCGEETPRPTGFALDTRPPERGPRTAPGLGREVSIDRRGRGVRAVGLPPPLKLRPATPTWARGDHREVRRHLHAVPSSVGAPANALPSQVAEARTDPLWHHAPEDALVDLDEAPTAELDETASLTARLGAAAIDAVVVLSTVVTAGLFAAFAFGPSRLSPYLHQGFDYVVDGLLVRRELGPLVVGLALVIGFVYATVAHALSGRTFGKRLVGLKVVTAEGERPTFGEACARSVTAIVGLALAGLGPAFVLVDRRRLALHDRLVGTRVVRG